MAKYQIHIYNREMTELEEKVDQEFDNDVEACAEALDIAQRRDIVVLFRRSVVDPRYLFKVAKFY